MFAAPYFFYQNYSETIRKAFAKQLRMPVKAFSSHRNIKAALHFMIFEPIICAVDSMRTDFWLAYQEKL